MVAYCGRRNLEQVGSSGRRKEEENTAGQSYKYRVEEIGKVSIALYRNFSTTCFMEFPHQISDPIEAGNYFLREFYNLSSVLKLRTLL